MEVNLELLRTIEKIREKAEQKPMQYPTDYTIRLIQAVIAERMGFLCRNDWIQLLQKEAI